MSLEMPLLRVKIPASSGEVHFPDCVFSYNVPDALKSEWKGFDLQITVETVEGEDNYFADEVLYDFSAKAGTVAEKVRPGARIKVEKIINAWSERKAKNEARRSVRFQITS